MLYCKTIGLFTKRQGSDAVRDKLFLLAVLALAIGLWLLFPQKKLPPNMSGSPHYTAADIVVHETLSDQVAYERITITGCCDGWHISLSHPFAPPRQPAPLTYVTSLTLNVAQPTKLLLTFRLDDSNISVKLDGETGPMHELELRPGPDILIPLEVQAPRSGTHYLNVAAWFEPAADDLLGQLWYRLFGYTSSIGTGQKISLR